VTSINHFVSAGKIEHNWNVNYQGQEELSMMSLFITFWKYVSKTDTHTFTQKHTHTNIGQTKQNETESVQKYQ